MKSNSLELLDVVIAREDARLTPPFCLSLQSGDLLLLRGHNGSGKSTLLSTMAGLLPVAAGTITVRGQWPAAQAPLYLGHRLGLIGSMSVYDNVAFWARMEGFAELAAAAMHYFDLSDIADVPVETLSAGWQQRVALTRLITMPRTLWLLDEPTAHLDADGTALLQSLMQSRLEQGGIVVMSTHAAMEGPRIKLLDLDRLSAARLEEAQC